MTSEQGLTLKYMTPVDPSLLHQVRFNATGSGIVTVSCNCRTYMDENNHERHLPIGPSENLEMARVMYNDPRNHNLPFGREWRAKW